LDDTTVQSRTLPPPDSVAGTLRVEDADGLDSVWVTVDGAVAGENGSFDRVFTSRFRFPIAAGRGVGSQLPVRLRARDIAGFQVIRDTHVVVVP
jgi:hypothetical protein